jgi:hypothetical protein
MTKAERRNIEEQLAANKKRLSELEATLERTPHGGSEYERTRENMKSRIEQAKKKIAYMESKLAADSAS